MYNLTLDEAYQSVQFYGEMCGIRNLWESIERMELNWEDLDLHDRISLRLVRNDLTQSLVESEGGEI